jgi:hypothetical protein
MTTHRLLIASWLARSSLAAGGCLVVLSCAGVAPPPSFEDPPAPVVALPLSFREGLPELDVVVAAQHLSLMFDTGAGAAIALSPSVLQRLPGVAYTGRTRRFRDARGELLSSREFLLSELALGPLILHGVTGQELVYSEDFAPPNREGYVGRALVARHRLLIDYAARRLTILSGEAQPDERELHERPPTPVDVDSNGIVVRASLDGSRARFVLDTGATRSVLRLRGSSGRTARHDLVVCGDALPAFELLEPDMGPPGVDGMLGRSFFEARRVLVDLPGRQMWIGAPSVTTP